MRNTLLRHVCLVSSLALGLGLITGCGGGDDSSSSPTTPPPAATTYALTISSGTGSGSYSAGQSVTIIASAAPSGQQFYSWSTSTPAIVASPSSATTTVTMPASATTITATYTTATTPPPTSTLRLNHEGRDLGAAPTVTTPILFNTPEADAIMAALQIFPTTHAWNEDISARPLLANSTAMINQINADLATNRRTLRVFAEMNFVLVPDNQPTTAINFVTYPAESDPSPYPIPANLPIEGWPEETSTFTNSEWQRDAGNVGGDRHAIIIQPGTGNVWETWQTKLSGTTWQAANGAKFNLNSNTLRPDGWTSADAAGLSLLGGLIRYDECQRGTIEHAIRLIVARTRNAYLYPATHRAGSTTDANVPAMGQRLRLRASFVIPSNWTREAKAVATALKKYGALVADNGNFFSISRVSDIRFAAGAFDQLSTILVTDFEVIQSTGANEGPRSSGAPTVDAGASQSTTTSSSLTLSATSTGTGLSFLWSQLSGPGTASFTTPTLAATQATFPAAGTYVIRVRASDTTHTPAYDTVTITVTAPPPPPTTYFLTVNSGTGSGNFAAGAAAAITANPAPSGQQFSAWTTTSTGTFNNATAASTTFTMPAAAAAVTATYTAIPPPADTTAPSVPSGLVVSSPTTTTLTLNWTASTDNVGVTSYELLRDNTAVGTSTTTSYTFTGLTAATTYSLTVKALDAAGNKSAASAAASGTTASPAAITVLSENFNNATLPTSLGLGTQGGGVVELVSDPAQTYGGTGKSLKATYPAMAANSGGGVFAWGGVGLSSYNTDNVYIKFRAKMPAAKHGLKFVKIFGQQLNPNTPNVEYANTTFGLDYTGTDLGAQEVASFGDGSALANDTARVLFYSGANPAWSGRSYGLPGYSVRTPQGRAFRSTDWGSDWHLFEFAVKFNSGTSAANERNDGAILVRIDGQVYLEARGLYNRHYNNLPIDALQILGWTQRPGTQTTPSFEIWYDDIEVKVNDWDFLATPAPASHQHGDTVTLTGSYGTANVSKTFLGGAGGPTESLAVDAPIPDANGWSFAEVSNRPVIKNDASRGKVLFNTEDSATYNAERRYDHGSAIPEQRYLYKAHYVRNVMLLDGAPYTKSYQWKHERINWENSISDGDCEIKTHNWLTQGGISFVNRAAGDASTYYGSAASVPDSNGGWALMETFVFTGTQGQTDGKVITRIHKNGTTVIGINRQTERVYADPAKRFRYFLEQNYFGNFGQIEDGVDNALPKPQTRQLYSDDSRVIVGLDASTGWKRVELRDTVALSTATIREIQDWTSWNGNITVRLNTGGLPSGTHNLHLVVIDGLDANGHDIVAGSHPITVVVP